MVAAATEKAESVIAEHAYTLVPSEYFDRLLAALDGPVEGMPTIETATARQRERPTFKRV